MEFLLILLMLGVCQLLDKAADYQEEPDEEPTFRNKVLRAVHNWIIGEEERTNP